LKCITFPSQASITPERREKTGKKPTKKEEKKKKKEEKQLASGDLIEFEGLKLRTNTYLRVNVGPIIGKVTTKSVIVLLEVSNEGPVEIFLVGGGHTISKEQHMPREIPKAFYVEGLHPDTQYKIYFGGLNKKAIVNRTGQFRTFPEKITKLNIAAVSCDRPERTLDGETNMWTLLEKELVSNEIQLVLHLGDQVYGQKELTDANVIFRQAEQDGLKSNEDFLSTVGRVQNRLGDIYRFTWNLRHTAKCLATGSHLMIWSDNDLYNDFTIAKDISPLMIHVGQLVYRRYQRQLWDPDYELSNDAAEEFIQKIGPIGIIMIDMRGNRIDFEGRQFPDNPIVSPNQWKLIESVFHDPEMKVILVCSEIPFVGDTPEVAKKNSTKPDLEFLKDHWVYSDKELVRLLELASDWKHNGKSEGKEVIFIGGDIHVGVTSVIHDHKHNQTIQHLTATPITNHVCKFFPALTGKVNERFSYEHKVAAARNYGLVSINLENGVHVSAKLVEDPHPIAHH